MNDHRSATLYVRKNGTPVVRWTEPLLDLVIPTRGTRGSEEITEAVRDFLGARR